MDINNIKNYKTINNQKINTKPTTKPTKDNIPSTKDNIPPTKDDITPADINISNIGNIKTNNPKLPLPPTILDNETNKKDKVNPESSIPKNLAIFEADNDSNFCQKQVDVNKIRAFGPTNLPKTAEEMFINPKYL
jgi:hypothetical protein